jgi:capsular exopolysaccharide synthesis family protein
VQSLALEGDALASAHLSEPPATPRRGLLAGERLLRGFRRWAGIVAIAMIVGGVVSFSVSRLVPPEYRATAQLYLAPAPNATASVDIVGGQNLARSYAQLANSSVVLRTAMDDLGWTDLKTFRDRATSTWVRDTSIITVSFKHGDPEFAARAANAIANAFIVQSRTLQSSIQGGAVQQLDEQIKQLQDDIRALDTLIATTPADQQTQRVQLDGQRQTKQQTLAQLLKTRDDINLASARAQNNVSLWESAVAPTEPDSPHVGLNTALGALLAGLLVVLAIGMLGYVEDRIGDFDAMHEKLGITPLAEVYRASANEATGGMLFVRDAPMSPDAEAFRGLRTNILFASVDRRPRTILVTSALPLEGKSVVSANLALAFAQAGSPTVLIDADLRRPSQHRLFGRSSSTGLTTLLTQQDPMSRLVDFSVAPNLHLLPSGPLPPDPAEFLSSARMSALLEALANRAPDATVIIDTSPTLAVADAIALSAKVDACLVVVDSARTRTGSAIRAVESLRRVRARIVGGVVNKVRTTPAGYYGYYGPSQAPPRRPLRSRLRLPFSPHWLLVPLIGTLVLGASALFARAGQSATPELPRKFASLERAISELTAAQAAWDGDTRDGPTARTRLESADAYLADAAAAGADPARVAGVAQDIAKLRARLKIVPAATSVVADLAKTEKSATPTQLAVAGDVYAIDSATPKVWRIAASGVATVAFQKGTSGIGTPRRLAAQGDVLYVLDDAGRIFKWQREALSEVRMADRRHKEPVGLAVLSNSIYVLDAANGQVWRYRPETAGVYGPGTAMLEDPLPGVARNMAIDGDIWIVTADARVLHYAFNGGAPTATRVAFDIQWAVDPALPIAVQASAGRVYLLDDRARLFIVLSSDGRELARVATPSQLPRPVAFVINGDVVVSAMGGSIQRTPIPR